MNRDMIRRWTFPLVTAFAVMGGLFLFAWPGPNPDLWDDLATAAGLRPPAVALAGTWRWLLSLLCGSPSGADAATVLRLFGIFGGGAATLLAYGIFDSLLPDVIRSRLRMTLRGGLIVDSVLMGATLAFVCSEPVWRLCQGGGAPLVQLLLALLTIRQLLLFLFVDGMPRAYLVTLLSGIMIGFGAFGLLTFVAVWCAVFFKSLQNRDDKTNPLANPAVRNRALSVMTFLFIALAAGMMYADYSLYYLFGGVERADFILTDMAVVVLGDYYRSFLSQTTGLGALLAFIFCISPLIIAFAVLPKVLVPDRLQEWAHAVTLFAMGVVAWSQISCFQFLWARQWFKWADINDGFTASLLSLACALTLSWSFGILLANLNFGNIRRVAGYQYGEEAEVPAADRAIASMVGFNRCLRIGMVVLALLVLFGTLPMQGHRTLRRMLAVIDAYCDEVVRECGEADRVITDGALDAGVELAAFRQDRRILTLSLLSGDDPRSVKIRQRGGESEDELLELERSAGSALVYWLTVETNRLPQVAVQCGFDRRRRLFGVKDGWVSGLVARLGGRPPADLPQDIAVAHRMAEEVLDICETSDLRGIGNRRVLELFRFVQWRLAQMCRVRNANASGDSWTAQDDLDESLMKRLDEQNPELQTLMERVYGKGNRERSFLSPREGLILGLQRADFRLAKTFANTVIRHAPSDPQANFAMGMYHMMDERYNEAIPYLKRVLERRPEDPVALNNLAICYERLERPDEAVKYAERALRAAPKNQSIRENVERYRTSAQIIR